MVWQPISVYLMSKGSEFFCTQLCYQLFFLIQISNIKLSPFSRGRPEGSLFNSYYTKVLGRVLLLSLNCSTLPLICTLYCWVLSKEVSSTIFKVFDMTRPGIEPRSPGPLAKILLTNLHIIIRFQVFLSNDNNFNQIYLSHWCDQTVTTNLMKVDLGTIGIKEYSALPRAPELEPRYQMQFSIIHRSILLGDKRCLTPQQGDTVRVFKASSPGGIFVCTSNANTVISKRRLIGANVYRH